MGSDGFERDFSNRPELEGRSSTDGTVRLRWNPAPGEALVLEQAARSDFSDGWVRYSGSDPGSVVTGLAEGVHFFRLGDGRGGWSEPLAVRVEFLPKRRLALLLGLGATVVLATVSAIVAGFLSTRREGTG